MPNMCTCCVISSAVLVVSVLSGQEPRLESEPGLRNGPFSRTAVRNAPYAGIAATVVLKADRDGTHLRLTTTTRVYRDSRGRVRVDYEVPVDSRSERMREGAPTRTMTMLMVDDGQDSAGHRSVYSLDPASRTFRVIDGVFASALFNAETQFAIPTGVTAQGAPQFATFVTADVHATNGGTRESLGSARIEGIEAIGWRSSGVWPIVCGGCGGLPGPQTEERWESPGLRVVVLARHLDRGDAVNAPYPGQGIDIGYHLTNIVRDEPPAEVFNVPLDYVRRWGGPSDPDVIFGP